MAILAQAANRFKCHDDELNASFRAIHHIGDSFDRGIVRGALQRSVLSVQVLQATRSR